jgi:branched-subunit amino acid transport protein
MNIWLVMLAGGVLTYLTRLSFILLHGKMSFPKWLESSLRYVPPAVLSAIIFPDLLIHTGKLDLSISNDRLISGLLAILVAWITRNTLVTILSGMAALWLLQAVR